MELDAGEEQVGDALHKMLGPGAAVHVQVSVPVPVAGRSSRVTAAESNPAAGETQRLALHPHQNIPICRRCEVPLQNAHKPAGGAASKIRLDPRLEFGEGLRSW